MQRFGHFRVARATALVATLVLAGGAAACDKYEAVSQECGEPCESSTDCVGTLTCESEVCAGYECDGGIRECALEGEGCPQGYYTCSDTGTCFSSFEECDTSSECNGGPGPNQSCEEYGGCVVGRSIEEDLSSLCGEQPAGCTCLRCTVGNEIQNEICSCAED